MFRIRTGALVGLAALAMLGVGCLDAENPRTVAGAEDDAGVSTDSAVTADTGAPDTELVDTGSDDAALDAPTTDASDAGAGDASVDVGPTVVIGTFVAGGGAATAGTRTISGYFTWNANRPAQSGSYTITGGFR